VEITQIDLAQKFKIVSCDSVSAANQITRSNYYRAI
jgi:hypothetical protein